ncbi:MAG: tripartite tricarboxylate transporter permease [Desulfobacterales bacterium]|nr:tripartite tricarboxylate transporter permease [Desulfobacterales bacterium]
MVENLLLGFREAISWQSLGLMVLGSVWGFIGGALPGIQASTAMALILPLTWSMPPSGALMMLAAIYVSAEYSHSVPAILIRTPGTSAALVTTFDGYPLHQQGKGGKALSISLYGGFVGQLIGNSLLIVMVIPLSRIALAFGPPEFFALAVFGLTLVSSLGEKSVIKALVSSALGVAFATVGLDPLSGTLRFGFGVSHLVDGFETVAVLVGLLAVSEIFIQARDARPITKFKGSISTKLVTWGEFKKLLPLISWTSLLGLFIGALPGAGATIASLVAYSEAKRWSKHPDMFGKGSYEGVAAPETANNSAISGAMVPLLAFGIPGSGSAAIMIAALMLHGVTPGPMLFIKNPEIVYGLFVALFIATFMMLAMGLASIRPLIKLVSVPKPILLGCIMALVFVGMYTHNASLFNVGTALAFGLIGYLMHRYDFSPAACVLGFVLGPMVEISFRRSLIISNDSLAVFVQRPISLVLLVLAALTFIVPLIRFFRDFMRTRKNVSA